MAIITGDAGSNPDLVGTNAADQIFGLGGNDTLQGLGGNDRYVGGQGRDTMRDNTGNDIDTFIFDDFPTGPGTFGYDSTPSNRDRIQGFLSAEVIGSGQGDRIDVSGIDADLTRGGNQAFDLVGFNEPI